MRDGQFAGIIQVNPIYGLLIDNITIYFFLSFGQKCNTGSAFPPIDYKKTAYLDKTLENDPPPPHQNDPLCQSKVIPFRQSKVIPLRQAKVTP